MTAPKATTTAATRARTRGSRLTTGLKRRFCFINNPTRNKKEIVPLRCL